MRVIIIDDHTLMRKGMSALLSKEPDVEVAGEAGTMEEAKLLIERVNPDLVLTDIKFKDGSGLDFVKECHNNDIHCKFIVLTSSKSEAEFKQARQAGIDGYILKYAFPEELIYAMRLVSQGRKYYDPIMMDFVMNNDVNLVDELTPRELDVLMALGKGLKNSLIAKELYITEFTVKKHISQILSKLNLHDRTEAALFANARGLIMK